MFCLCVRISYNSNKFHQHPIKGQSNSFPLKWTESLGIATFDKSSIRVTIPENQVNSLKISFHPAFTLKCFNISRCSFYVMVWEGGKGGFFCVELKCLSKYQILYRFVSFTICYGYSFLLESSNVRNIFKLFLFFSFFVELFADFLYYLMLLNGDQIHASIH